MDKICKLMEGSEGFRDAGVGREAEGTVVERKSWWSERVGMSMRCFSFFLLSCSF